MEMQDIEISCALTHAIKHQHHVGDWVANADIESKCLTRAWPKLSQCYGITAGEECHVMAERHQFLSDI